MCINQQIQEDSCANVDFALRKRLAELLTQGCDERIVVDDKTGMHKYNGTNQPVQGSIRRSSCTFSVPTEDAFQAGLKALKQIERDPTAVELLQKQISQRLEELWSVSGAALTMFPSGTDAEFLPMLVALSRAMRFGGKMASVVTCAGEVGSGTTNAAIGRHFATLLPAPHMCPEGHVVGGSIFASTAHPEIDAIELKLRTPDGKCKSMSELDTAVSDSVDKALCEDEYAAVLVHVVVGCKTGHLMPSMACIHELVEKYGERVVPVVDACQTRMTDCGLKDLVSAGFAVLTTGSKFYGGPPFCGAAILPPKMVTELNLAMTEGAVGDLRGLIRSSTLGAYIGASLVPPELHMLKEALPSDAPNLGLIIRWQMALHNIDRYHRIPDDARCALRRSWMTETAEMIRAKGLETVNLYEEAPTVDQDRVECGMHADATILCFDLRKPGTDGAMERLSMTEAKRVHNLMARDLSSVEGLSEAEREVLGKRCFLAQPVSLTKSGPHVLRAAVGAPLVLRLHEDGDLDELRKEDETFVEKMNLVLRKWESMPI